MPRQVLGGPKTVKTVFGCHQAALAGFQHQSPFSARSRAHSDFLHPVRVFGGWITRHPEGLARARCRGSPGVRSTRFPLGPSTIRGEIGSESATVRGGFGWRSGRGSRIAGEPVPLAVGGFRRAAPGPKAVLPSQREPSSPVPCSSPDPPATMAAVYASASSPSGETRPCIQIPV